MIHWLDLIDQEDFIGCGSWSKKNEHTSSQEALIKITYLLQEVESRINEVQSLLLKLQEQGEL